MSYEDPWEPDVIEHAEASRTLDVLKAVTRYDGAEGMNGARAPGWTLEAQTMDAVMTLSNASARGVVSTLSPYGTIRIDQDTKRGAVGQHQAAVRIPKEQLLSEGFTDRLIEKKDDIQGTLLKAIARETSASRSR